MNKRDLKSLSTDELWMLREEISATLAVKLTAEKAILEKRLSLLRKVGVEQRTRAPERRPYPPVFPKFRNPDEPSQTWAGRGKQPRWLRKQLRSGKRIDDFRIGAVAA
jgi:DNA-binding protein H-NS